MGKALAKFSWRNQKSALLRDTVLYAKYLQLNFSHDTGRAKPLQNFSGEEQDYIWVIYNTILVKPSQIFFCEKKKT